ncbi:SRPBCC family protein [Enterococcus sp. CSURQ0835]|uniref:SRPBCC family protein n=1 Tax=Enterococcus sp. CSURQ0835 TaxID=2681394 RepID=UPI00135B12C2|nr:SRPBCC family protein [Enterococcus sp. CSURQ0835]
MIKKNESESQKFNIPINNDAPVTAHAKIQINSELEKVSQTLADLAEWTNWRRKIDYVKVINNTSEVKVGTEFVWKSGGLKYKSKVYTFSENEFGWTGKTLGAFAVHNWCLKSLGSKTEVEVWESLTGIAIKLMKKNMERSLPKMMENDLADLKAACEKN